MTALRLDAVTKSFARARVLRGIDLTVPEGGFTAILGPSGCGKTTLLRLIAGFENPDSGRIAIDGVTVFEARHAIPPERRRVGYVAQEGALFPHLTVADNITFGLPRRERRVRHRVAELLELVGMRESYADRFPHQLSGGEQQRVALARAMAPNPSVVLLDEPFSALDAGLRVETRLAVADALTATATTTVLVTHDQAEALSMARQVAIMRDGSLAQAASPTELYDAPADIGVAVFVGEAVVLPGTISASTVPDDQAAAGMSRGKTAESALGRLRVRATDLTGPARLMIRPEQIVIHPGSDATASGVSARVEGFAFYGHDATVELRLASGGTAITCRCDGRNLPHPGDDVLLTVDGEVIAYPRAIPAAHP
ncbi:MAG: ABC transporter ATP-binding protein [Microbacteriaceae bacterium]